MSKLDFETLKEAVAIVENWECHDVDEAEKDSAVWLVESLFELFERTVERLSSMRKRKLKRDQ